MKKKLLVSVLVVAALAILATGVVAAQGTTPPGDPSPMHQYMEQALADALGITVDELQTQREAGKRVGEIAKGLGFSEEELPTLLSNARIAGLEAAAANGLISEEMLEWMKGRIQQRLENAGDGRGPRHGFMHGWMRGFRFGQSNPQ